MSQLAFFSFAFLTLVMLTSQRCVDDSKLSCEYLKKVCSFNKTNALWSFEDFSCDEDYEMCKMKRKK